MRKWTSLSRKSKKNNPEFLPVELEARCLTAVNWKNVEVSWVQSDHLVAVRCLQWSVWGIASFSSCCSLLLHLQTELISFLMEHCLDCYFFVSILHYLFMSFFGYISTSTLHVKIHIQSNLTSHCGVWHAVVLLVHASQMTGPWVYCWIKSAYPSDLPLAPPGFVCVYC